MQNKDNFRTTKNEGDSLGKSEGGEKIKNNPAPKKADKESEMTPEENEVYVDLEPDELHIGDEDVEEVDKKTKK
jgi:hypothetical protein